MIEVGEAGLIHKLPMLHLSCVEEALAALCDLPFVLLGLPGVLLRTRPVVVLPELLVWLISNIRPA